MEKKAYFHGVGRRKSSVARVHLAPFTGKKGSGSMIVNGKAVDQFFSDQNRVDIVMQPLRVIGVDLKDYAIKVTVRGGGCTGQAGAISLGLARAFNALEMHQLGLSKEEAHAMQEEAARIAQEAAQSDEEEGEGEGDVAPTTTSKRAWYVALKRNKLLSVDARRVERKKVGLRGARRKPQFSKR